MCVGERFLGTERQCKGPGAGASSARSGTQKSKVRLEDLKMEMIQNAVGRQAELKVIQDQS